MALKKKEKEKEIVTKIAENVLSQSIIESDGGIPSSLTYPTLTEALPTAIPTESSSSSSSSSSSLPTLKKRENQTQLNSTDLWGPVLIICKAKDLVAWSEGLNAVFGCTNQEPRVDSNSTTPGSGSSSSNSSSSYTDSDDKSSSVGTVGTESQVSTGWESVSGIKDEENKLRYDQNNPHFNEVDSTNNVSQSNVSRVRTLSYYGSDSDRALIRSYLLSNTSEIQNLGPGSTTSSGSSSLSGVAAGTGSNTGSCVWTGLYGERSTCHIIIATYESFMSDVSDFLGVFWNSVVFDSPWGLVSNTHENKTGRNYLGLQDDIINLKARHRIFTCESLSNRSVPMKTNINSLCNSQGVSMKSHKRSDFDRDSNAKSPLVFPDLVACAIMLFPSLQNIVQFPSDTDEVTAVSTAIALKGNSLSGTYVRLYFCQSVLNVNL